jgi:NitT/TauT family transport system ATP-binding protein
MDEPFSALDAQTRVRMQNLFLGLWEAERKTVILVTHDVTEALTLADDVVVLSHRPARIKLNVKVDLPRPRRIRELFGNPRFLELTHEVWESLDVDREL